MVRHGRHVIVWAAAFVVAEEEDAVFPLRAGHERIDDLCHLRLAEQDGLEGARMLVVNAISGLNEGEAGQRAIGEIG